MICSLTTVRKLYYQLLHLTNQLTREGKWFAQVNTTGKSENCLGTCRQSPAQFIEGWLGILCYFTLWSLVFPRILWACLITPLEMNKEREVKSSAYCHALEESLSWGQNQTVTYPKPFAFARPPPLLLHLSKSIWSRKREKLVVSMPLSWVFGQSNPNVVDHQIPLENINKRHMHSLLWRPIKPNICRFT